MKIYPVSLGCPKNRTDTEKLLAALVKQGDQVVLDPAEADLLLVNTCAFIREAVEESIDVILELAEGKYPGQRLVVCGCLVTRYGEELLSEFPEVDLFLGIEPYRRPDLLRNQGQRRLYLKLEGPEFSGRLLTESPFYAYLKVAEGCSHACSFCLIPRLRGPLRSIPEELILAEARNLLAQGVQEIILVGQDVSAYGLDQEKRRLGALIKRLVNLTELRWLRLLYLNPQGVTEELLDAMAESEKICPYFDLPVQHASPKVLKAMRRPYQPEEILGLIEMIRKRWSEAGIRTAVIVGFPGETEEDFDLLLEFIKEARFDHLGAFIFSPEEGTPAARMPDQVPEEIKQERFTRLMELQQDISRENLRARLGKETEVLVEGLDEEGRLYGHARFQAPEIDGVTFVSGENVSPGDIVRVRLIEADIYDLKGLVLR